MFHILQISVHNCGIEVYDNSGTECDHLLSDHGVKANLHETPDLKSQLADEVIFEESSSVLNKNDYSNGNWYQVNLFHFNDNTSLLTNKRIDILNSKSLCKICKTLSQYGVTVVVKTQMQKCLFQGRNRRKCSNFQ